MNGPVPGQRNSVLDGVRFEVQPGFLCAYLAGSGCDVERYLECFRAIGKECRARHQKRVLVVDDLQPDLPFLQVCAWINRLFVANLQGLTLAVARERCARPEHYRFGETMAQNQGLNLRIFFDATVAERWLLSVGTTASTPSRKLNHRLPVARRVEPVLKTHLD